MKTKLIRLTMINRFSYKGFLYQKSRAYKVGEDEAEQKCDLTHNDMPVFKVVKEDSLNTGEVVVPVIDLTVDGGKSVIEEIEEEGEVEEGNKKQKRKPTVKKPKAPKKKLGKTKKPDNEDISKI